MSDELIVTGNQTEKLCPFVGFTTATSTDEDDNEIITASGVKCIKDKCQLWVSNNSTSNPFRKIVSQNTSDASEEDGVDGTVNEGRCGAQVSDFNENIFRLMHHLHAHHEHPAPHFSALSIPLLTGGPYYNPTTPKSLMLAMEVDTNEDQDGNGKIFGKDFGISIDSNTPNIIKMMNNSNTVVPPVLVPWNDYTQNIFRPYYKSAYPNKLNLEGGFVKITGGLFDAEDENFELTFEIGNPTLDIDYINLNEYVGGVNPNAPIGSSGGAAGADGGGDSQGSSGGSIDSSTPKATLLQDNDTTITVNSSNFSLPPTTNYGNFYVTINSETLLVTNVVSSNSTYTFTVKRAQEGTTKTVHAASSQVLFKSNVPYIKVLNKSTLYIRIPSMIPYIDEDVTEITLNFRITNSGNTFDQSGFLNNFAETGGVKIIENAIKLNTEPNNEEIQTKLEEAWNEIE